MAMDKARYPQDWEAISRRIRLQAGESCEVCHKTAEDRTDNGAWRIVLTAHHIGIPLPGQRRGDPGDKMDCRDENIVILCQKHHLEAEAEIKTVYARFPASDQHFDQVVAPVYRKLERIAHRRALFARLGVSHDATSTPSYPRPAKP